MDRLEWQIEKCFKLEQELRSLKEQLEKEKSEYRDTAEALHYFRKKYKAKKNDLEKAEKVIEFYSEKAWTFRCLGSKDWVVISDIEQISDKDHVDWNTGGKKARQYFQEKQDQLKGGEK